MASIWSGRDRSQGTAKPSPPASSTARAVSSTVPGSLNRAESVARATQATPAPNSPKADGQSPAHSPAGPGDDHHLVGEGLLLAHHGLTSSSKPKNGTRPEQITIWWPASGWPLTVPTAGASRWPGTRTSPEGSTTFSGWDRS